MFTCSAASTTCVFRGIPALSTALSADGNNCFLSPSPLPLSPAANQLSNSSCSRLNCAEQKFHFYMKDALFKGITQVPWGTGHKALSAGFFLSCVQLLRLNWRLGGLFWLGQVKTWSQSFCASPGSFPLPSIFPHPCCLSWLCKCSRSWVNYNSRWYTLV